MNIFCKKQIAQYITTQRVRAGFTLVETIIYLALLIIILVAVVNGMLLLTNTYRNVKAIRNIENSAISAMERIIRETRQAESVDTAQSSFNTNPGILVLNTLDPDTASMVALKFYLSGEKIMMDRAGVNLGQLSNSGARVTSMVFRQISTTTSQAIKIEMTIETPTSTIYRIKNFYGTGILRESYQ